MFKKFADTVPVLAVLGVANAPSFEDRAVL
jgi:hypothetical protein